MYEFKREVPLNETYDVIVAGGGPSGCAAAIASAREGARTLLIEGTGALGGMGTSGLVPAWCPYSDKEKMIYRGIAKTVYDLARPGVPHFPKDNLDWVPIDAELLKRVYDDLVTGAGADVLFGTSLIGVDTSEGRVGALIVSNKAGVTAYRAKVYVDATGDADLCAWAGAEYLKGDDQTGDMQAATHCFTLVNVDEYALNVETKIHPAYKTSPIHEIMEDPEFDLIRDRHVCDVHVGPGTVTFNAGHVWADGTDPASLSKAYITGRKIARQFQIAFARKHRAYANAYLVNTASLLGVRETRRVVGDYMLTGEDYLARRSFEDEICRCSYYVDIHSRRSAVEKKESEAAAYGRYSPGESYGVPYRCLTPKGLSNVLVAGRAISCDRAIQGSVRVMPPALCTGEAAGLAAALASAANVSVHDVDVARLRARLREEGAYLP